MAEIGVKTRAAKQRRTMGTGQASIRAQQHNAEAWRYVVDHGGNHSEIYNRALAAFYFVEMARKAGCPIVEARFEIPLDLVTKFIAGDQLAGQTIAQHIAEQLCLVGRGEIIPAQE